MNLLWFDMKITTHKKAVKLKIMKFMMNQFRKNLNLALQSHQSQDDPQGTEDHPPDTTQRSTLRSLMRGSLKAIKKQ